MLRRPSVPAGGFRFHNTSIVSLTLQEALTGVDWTSCTGFSLTDSRLLARLNEAQRRIMNKGEYVGSWGTYQICAHSGCLTWPRQVQTILAAWRCARSVKIRSEWFETLPQGYGRQDPKFSCWGDCLDRGRGFVQFDDITTPSLIRFYPTFASDAGATLLVQGRDSNGNWIYTQGGNVNGVMVTLTSAPYVTANDDNGNPILFSPPGLVAVQKPVTKGPVRAWGYDPSLVQPLRALAYWEPDETLPDYRRSLVPGLGQQSSSSSPDSCGNCTSGADVFTVKYKKRFVPVAQPSDYFAIENLPALKEMVVSILKRERGLIQEAEAYEAVATRLLEEELSTYLGPGVTQPLKVDDYAFAAAENYLEGGMCAWH